MFSDIKLLFNNYISLKDDYDNHIERYKAQVQAKDKEIQSLKSDLFYANETILHISKELNSRKSSDHCADSHTLVAVRGSKSVAAEVAKVGGGDQMVPQIAHLMEQPPTEPTEKITPGEKQHLEFIQSMHENHVSEIEGLHSTYRETLEEIENQMKQAQLTLEQELETQ